MVDGLRPRRPDDTELVSNRSDVRKDLADRLPALAEFLEGVLGAEAIELLALQLSDRLSLGIGLGHRLAVHLTELRLVIEGLEMRRSAGHVEMDNPLGLALEMQGIDDSLPVIDLHLCRPRRLFILGGK